MLWSILALSPAVTFAALTSLKLKGPSTLPPDASHDLHPSLASFSIETAFFEEFMGNVSDPNRLSLQLLQNLADRTGVPAEIRIGGITADSTYWRPSQQTSLDNFIDKGGALHNTTVGPEFWRSMSLLPAGTQITVNLDLHDLNYTGALEMARSAIRGIPADQFVAFESLKGPNFQIAATAEDPLWPYGTPRAISQLDCVSALAAGAEASGVVKLCSEHTYQYSVCDPPRIAVATLPNLVNHTRLAMYLDLWQPRIKTVRNQLGPHSFLIGEYNSVSCSGKDGVSNTFGQALWLLDTTFYAASLNVSRLYLHQGGPLALQSSTQLNHGGLSFYDMWYPVQNQNGAIQVFPSYATYLFIDETLGHSKNMHISNIYPGRQANGSTITTALGDESAGQLVAYGFWDTSSSSGREAPAKLALLNLQIYNRTQTNTTPRPVATFDISSMMRDPRQEVVVRRLQAPGADVKLGNMTTWAGQHFASGTATGQLVEERITGGKITVAASEAALVVIL